MRTLIQSMVAILIVVNIGCGRSAKEEVGASLQAQAVGTMEDASSVNVVSLPVADDPTVSFRILFNVGSQDDPKGKEGLAALTASMISQGSSAQHSYEEIQELLYPIASSIAGQIDKEMTVFSGRAHTDNLDQYYSLLREIILEPAFDEADFKRVKDDRLNYLRTSLRYAQDEELGKETLSEVIFEGTPYGHAEEGSVAAVSEITLDDVKMFYAKHYTVENVVVGLGGGYTDAFVVKVKTDFAALPRGQSVVVTAPMPRPISGIHVKIVEKSTGSTAISFGHPIEVTRGSREFYALKIARTWLGEHRNGFSHLYEVIREKRGLNYGDYAYIEHFPRGHSRRFPPPNVARRQQVFQVWIRPVPHDVAVFAFRAALRELQMLVDNGMSEDQFALTTTFLKNYNLHYASTTSAKLGYAMDDQFYGIESGHWSTYRKMLDEITLDEVNAAIKKHLNYNNLNVVFITEGAEALRDVLVNNKPSPITYGSEKPAEIMEEDKEISTYPLAIEPANVTIVKVEELFEG